MEDLVIQRRCYKRVRSVYTLKINQEYLDRLNSMISSHIVNPENFEPLTFEEVKQIAYDEQDPVEDKDPNSRLIKELDFYYFWAKKDEQKRTWRTSLLWLVKDSFNDDLWDSYEDIEDEEIDDSEDEVLCGGADDDNMNFND